MDSFFKQRFVIVTRIALFLIGVLLFFFDLIVIHIPESAVFWHLSGFDLTFGSVETSGTAMPQVFESEFFGIFILGLLIIGLMLSFLQTTKMKPFLFLIALAGIISLLFLQMKFQFDYKTSHSYWPEMMLGESYWLLMLDFTVIGFISFIGSKSANKLESCKEKTTININIITKPSTKTIDSE